jgi:4a-hydroxytetrahydrobiopterin dehydratase
MTRDEIAARLVAELPAWHYADGTIRRTYRTNGWKGTLMVVNTIGHLAEVAWHHPELVVGYDSIDVRLSTHSAKAITDKDFALAAKIESVVLWQPATEGNALEGTPTDPRFAYIRTDA